MDKVQRGYTLVELLVVSALVIILAQWVMQFYLQATAHARNEQIHFELEESGFFALDVIKKELRLAGLFANSILKPDVKIIGVNCKEQWLSDVSSDIQFFDGNGAAYPEWVACMLDTNTLEKNSDIVAVKRSFVNPLYSVVDGEAYGDDNAAVLNGYYVLRRGFQKPQLLSAKNISISKYVDSNVLDISFYQYQVSIFYVRNYSVYKGDNTPALMILSLVNNSFSSMALVEGVEKLEFAWLVPAVGVHGKEYRNIFSPSQAEVNASERVQVSLLMRSQDFLLEDQSGEYHLSSKHKLNFSDKYLRKVFSAAVYRRNVNH